MINETTLFPAIAPFSCPGGSISLKTHFCDLVDNAIIALHEYECRVNTGKVSRKYAHLLAVLDHNNRLIHHPMDYQAEIRGQHSSYVLEGRYYLFAERWKSYKGEELRPYDDHISRIDLHTLTIETHFHIPFEGYYIGVDVDESQKYALIAHRFDDFPQIDIFDAQLNAFIRFDCTDLIDTPISNVSWGDSIYWLRCDDYHGNVGFKISVDWQAHRILWNRKYET